MAEDPNFTYLGNSKVTYQLEIDVGETYSYVLTISVDESGGLWEMCRSLFLPGGEVGPSKSPSMLVKILSICYTMNRKWETYCMFERRFLYCNSFPIGGVAIC